MTRPAKTMLMLFVSALALTACGSSKGPGNLGSKNDIVVRNNGLPGADTGAPLPPSSAGDAGITSTVENADAIPAPEVGTAETLAAPAENLQSLPPADPAVEAAAQQVEDAQAPVPSTAVTPINDGSASSTAPTTETIPADIVAPEPVAQPAPAPAPAVTSAPPAGTPIETTGAPIVPDDAPQSAVNALGARKVSPSSVYPAKDYPAEALVEEAQPQSVAQPVPQQTAPTAPASAASVDGPYAYKPAPAGSAYKADPNAPYSPSAAVAASSSAPSGATGLNDPATIKAAQAALKLKGAYGGPETGSINADFLNALSKYQGDNGLPLGGLNIETLRSLGIVQ